MLLINWPVHRLQIGKSVLIEFAPFQDEPDINFLNKILTILVYGHMIVVLCCLVFTKQGDVCLF